MSSNTNLPRGGGVVFNTQNLKKKSVVMDKDGNIIEAKTPQEKKVIIRKLLGRR